MAKGNHGTDKRYVYKLMDSPIGKIDAGGERRRPRRDPVGEGSTPSRAAEHRGSRRETSGAHRDRAPARGGDFAGRRTAFDVRLDVAGTSFQRKVWNALLTIPFGQTLILRGRSRSRLATP